jgi:tyrosinase
MSQAPGVMSESNTFKIGTTFSAFRPMEDDPHGAAHVRFLGWMGDPATAPKDPLFFLLHANVDRLWAKWQKLNHRTDPDAPESFGHGIARAGSPDDPTRIGHRLKDVMWPWDLNAQAPRPTLPVSRPNLADSTITPHPGPHPTVRSMIDYQAKSGGDYLGFDYDDVKFEP